MEMLQAAFENSAWGHWDGPRTGPEASQHPVLRSLCEPCKQGKQATSKEGVGG